MQNLKKLSYSMLFDKISKNVNNCFPMKFSSKDVNIFYHEICKKLEITPVDFRNARFGFEDYLYEDRHMTMISLNNKECILFNHKIQQFHLNFDFEPNNTYYLPLICNKITKHFGDRSSETAKLITLFHSKVFDHFYDEKILNEYPSTGRAYTNVNVKVEIDGEIFPQNGIQFEEDGIIFGETFTSVIEVKGKNDFIRCRQFYYPFWHNKNTSYKDEKFYSTLVNIVDVKNNIYDIHQIEYLSEKIEHFNLIKSARYILNS